MKVSELIESLAIVLGDEGDIEVVLYSERLDEFQSADSTNVMVAEYRNEVTEVVSETVVEINY